MASVSPAFPCPHCGDRSFRRQPVDVTASTTERPVLAHLSVCSSCGENYLAVVHEDSGRSRVETWDYYLDREPALRRVRGYEVRGRFKEPVEVTRLFFVGDEPVSETLWREALADHRASPSPLVPARPTEARYLPAQLSATVVSHCRAWWSRQSAAGHVPIGHLPVALLAPPSLPGDGTAAGPGLA